MVHTLVQRKISTNASTSELSSVNSNVAVVQLRKAYFLWYAYFFSIHQLIMASNVACDNNNTAVEKYSVSMKECYENYIVIDAGANLTNKKYNRDLDSVIQRAQDSGVQKIVVVATSIKTSKDALRLTRIYPGILYSTAGVHPHDAKSWSEGYLEELKEIALNQECVAVGECGLDYNRDFSPPDVQKEIFEKQLMLACELKKPLFLHERDAHEDMVEILSKYIGVLPTVVIHSFMGTTDQAQKYLEMGIYLGVTGFLCKDKSDNGIRTLLEKNVIPLDQLLVQTDSPYMYPNTRASKLPTNVKEALTERSLTYLQRYCTFQRNEPCSLPAIVEMIAAFMKKSPEEVALATSFNALKIFEMSR